MEKAVLYKLKEYLASLGDYIKLAFVFGSNAKNMAGQDSDFDIAIYLTDKSLEEKIWKNISAITQKEVDLVLLNDAPATLISNVFKTGLPLVIKDRNLYWDLYLKSSMEAEDFARFASDYLKIYQRSSSLSPEDKTRLLERMQFLKSELAELDSFKKIGLAEYKSDKIQRRNIERWTENICNATIDIAKIILASEKNKMPKTYEQALSDFGIAAGLSEEELFRFAWFANLRNILAHEYLDIVFSNIQKFIDYAPSIYQKIFKLLDRYLQ